MSDDYARTDLIPKKAPAFLDRHGMMIEPDPLANAWKQLQAHFTQLHGQRLVELMATIFRYMPEDERIALEWEDDEISCFYLRFSNGWSFGEHLENPDEPCRERCEHRSPATAPEWFPRDAQGMAQWKQWRNLLSITTIGAGVDEVALEALEALSKRKGGLSRDDLQEIAQTLVREDWQACLDQAALAERTPSPRRATPRARL